MAQRQLDLSCERLRKDLNAEEDKAIRATALEDVRATIAQTERELASRQSLRNFDRLSPYINAIERYGKVIEVFCNSDLLVPYIWAPLKFIILAVKEQTRALDRILGAYAQVGNALPRFSALQESFKKDHDFQTLFAFLYDDITEFHREVYRLIRRKSWPLFFSSTWGRFERRLSSLITSIEKISALIDKQTTTFHILEVKEWRRKSLEDFNTLEARRTAEQWQAVLNWLGTEVQAQKDKLDWLNARSHEGTSTWIVNHNKFRSWLQRGRGSPVVWIHGKPGSVQGKSVLVSQVVSFITTTPKNKDQVLFFFCNYRTQAHQVTTQIFKAYLAQCVSQDHDIAPFLYEEYVAKGLSPVAKVLKPALVAVSQSADMVRLIVDGLDEIEATEHKPVLRELKRITKICGETCKLLIASRDIPSIRSLLGKTPQIFLGDERNVIEDSMRLVVGAKLTELNESLKGKLEADQMEVLQTSIINNAEGMFLWISPILKLLEESGSLVELESIVTTLPRDLEEMYRKLLDRIRSRCDTPRLSRVSRMFEWLLFAEGEGHIQKYDVLLGSSLHEDCMILNRKNMPLPTALDICKPLIEEGPGGTVALIHSTLPYFLIKSQNGPLISPRTSHEHIAFACVSHLIQILQLVQPEVQPEERMKAVGLGRLGLQRYANENWISHVLNYLDEVTHAELSSDVPLTRQLLQLTVSHDVLLQTLRPNTDGDDQGTAPAPALQKLNAFPGVCDLIRRVISFQDSFTAQQLVDGPDILAVESDTTLFSLANSNYQAVVERLLRSKTEAGLTEADLIAFKAQFGHTAFACPVKGCNLGFSSENELNDHKTQRHKQRLRCYQGNCVNNDVGFASPSSLHQHVKKVHKNETPRIPKALKRRKITEDQETPVSPGSDPIDRYPLASGEMLSAISKVPPHHLPNNGLGDLELEHLAPQYKKAGDDWLAFFSDSNGTKMERYIKDLARDLFEAVKTCHGDIKTLERLSELLPDLLTAFAVKIGHQALNQTDLDIAYVVQTHRGEIQSLFQEEFLSLQGTTKVDDARHGELSIERFLEDHTTEFDRLPEDKLPESPEGSGPDLEDKKSEVDAGKYRDYVLQGPAYHWLIGTLQRESTLKRATPVDVMNRIRADILAALPASLSVSRRPPTQRYKATFELRWDPLVFVEEQSYTEAAEIALRRAITITGTADDAQAATTEDYLVQTWPNGGQIMQLVEDVTRCGRKSPVAGVLSDKTELEVWIDDDKFVALATGPADSIVEVGQQFAWLGAALQSSTSETGIAPCAPFVSSATLKPTDTLSSESDKEPEIICVIDFDIQLPDIDNTERPGQCWQNMFRNPVMVVGYPILSKPANNPGLGLEMPLNMMPILAGSDRVYEFEDKILIKGFSTMVSTTKRLGNIIVWHYFYNVDRGKISHLDLMLDHEFNGSLSLSELESARHVVGWCSKCKFYAGMLNASKDLKRVKGLPQPSVGCRLDRISLSGGRVISASASIAIGLKDLPAHLTIKGYINKLKSIDEKYVVFWDEADKRGWLVNGTSALLHLVRASLHHSSQDKFSSVFRWKQSNMTESASAVEVLINLANRGLELYADKPTVSDEDEVKLEDDTEKESTAKKRKWDYYTFQDLVEQHYHYLDQIIDYQARAEARNGVNLKANFRTRLEGWDFVELATDSSIQIFPRVATLHALGWGWVDFIRSIGAVTLFASHFGELMKPEVFDGMCPKWKTLPKGRYYLAASGADLKKVSFDSGSLVWHSPTEPVASCRCQERSALRTYFGGHYDPVQVFYPKRSRLIRPTNRCHTIYTDGAYVFGHNVTRPYNWKAGKKEDEDDLEPRSSGDSSDSGFREDLAQASIDQSSQSNVSVTDTTILSPLQSDPSTARSSEPPLTPSTGPSHVNPEGSLPHRLTSKRLQPSDPSFESETGHSDDAHRKARRLKRQK